MCKYVCCRNYFANHLYSHMSFIFNIFYDYWMSSSGNKKSYFMCNKELKKNLFKQNEYSFRYYIPLRNAKIIISMIRFVNLGFDCHAIVYIRLTSTENTQLLFFHLKFDCFRNDFFLYIYDNGFWITISKNFPTKTKLSMLWKVLAPILIVFSLNVTSS